METGWVIEDKDGQFIGAYFGAYAEDGKRQSCLAWRHGHENALRFARREDAEIVRGICETQGIQFAPDAPGVCEHQWG